MPFGVGYNSSNKTAPIYGMYPPPTIPQRDESYRKIKNTIYPGGISSEVYDRIPYADEDGTDYGYLYTKSKQNSKIGFDIDHSQPLTFAAYQYPSHPSQYGRSCYNNDESKYEFNEEYSAKNSPVSFSSIRGYVRKEHQKKHNGPETRRLPTDVPALYPQFNFDPDADASHMRRAMEGLGTEDKTLINILCRRTNEQRQQIQHVYRSPYGRDLIEDVKAKTSGNFEKVLVALLMPTWNYRVKVLHDAFGGIGTDDEALIEFLCIYTNHEINILNQMYQEKYKKPLEQDIGSHAPEHLKPLLVAAVRGKREEDNTIDQELACREADMLVQAFKLGTDETAFNVVFSRRSFDQIRTTDEEYTKLTGHTLEEAIENEFTGCIKDALLALLQYAHNRYEYFANRLHKSMVGFGTNDKHLMRVVVSRSEIDLINIKTVFEQKYGKPLKSWIKGDTSGDYKICLLTLIQEA